MSNKHETLNLFLRDSAVHDSLMRGEIRCGYWNLTIRTSHSQDSAVVERFSFARVSRNQHPDRPLMKTHKTGC